MKNRSVIYLIPFTNTHTYTHKQTKPKTYINTSRHTDLQHHDTYIKFIISCKFWRNLIQFFPNLICANFNFIICCFYDTFCRHVSVGFINASSLANMYSFNKFKRCFNNRQFLSGLRNLKHKPTGVITKPKEEATKYYNFL